MKKYSIALNLYTSITKDDDGGYYGSIYIRIPEEVKTLLEKHDFVNDVSPKIMRYTHDNIDNEDYAFYETRILRFTRIMSLLDYIKKTIELEIARVGFIEGTDNDTYSSKLMACRVGIDNAISQAFKCAAHNSELAYASLGFEDISFLSWFSELEPDDVIEEEKSRLIFSIKKVKGGH